jgi:hypothetical protein
MTELVRQPLVHPLTGQALDLDNATYEDLGRMLAEIDEQKLLLQELRNLVGGEVLSRQDLEVQWTTHAGDYKLTGASKQPVEEFDGLELRNALLELADAGVISQEAVDRAVETVITYKPKKAGIAALRKLGGDVKDLIDDRAIEVPRRRYVKVERA